MAGSRRRAERYLCVQRRCSLAFTGAQELAVLGPVLTATPYQRVAQNHPTAPGRRFHAFDASHLHTGYVEVMISFLQVAKAKVPGYGATRHFIAMVFLIAGKLSHLSSHPL